MLALKLIYDDRYDLNLGAHVFPSQKYRLVYERLLQDAIASQEDFVKPAPASDEDILRVHSQDYLYKLKTGSLTRAEVMRMEVPYSAELIEACWLAAGGSILSARRALRSNHLIHSRSPIEKSQGMAVGDVKFRPIMVFGSSFALGVSQPPMTFSTRPTTMGSCPTRFAGTHSESCWMRPA